MKKVHDGRASRRLIGLVLLLSLAALAMTGCIRFELSIAVNDDGSGVLGYTVAISEEFAELDDSMGGGMSIEEGLNLEDADLPPGAEAREYSEEGYRGVVVSVPFDDLAEIPSLLGAFQEDSLGEGLDLPDIRQDDNGDWHFSMLIPPLGGEPTEMSFIEEAIFADAWYRVRIKLPGEIAEHNADRVENGAMVWELDFTSTESRQLTARTITSGGLSLVVIGLVAAAAAVIALGAFVFLMRAWRRPRE